MDLTVWAAILSFVLCFIIFKFRAQSREGTIHDPARWPFFGDLRMILENRYQFQHLVLDVLKEHGNAKALSVAVPLNQYIVCADPKVVEHVWGTKFDKYVKGESFYNVMRPVLGHGIFGVDGELWKEQRKTASWMFSQRNLRDFMAKVFVERSKCLHSRLEQFADSGEVVDISDLFYRLTMDSFVEIAFGIRLQSLEKYPEEVKFSTHFDNSQIQLFLRTTLNPLWKIAKFLNVGGEPQLKKDVKFIDNYCANVIEQRRSDKTIGDRPDILSLFMKMAADKGQELSPSYLRDIVINFIIAGRDTTAAALSWEFFELAKRPEIVEKIRNEVDRVCANGELDYGRVKELEYTHASFSETLRLYPSVPAELKFATEDDILPNGAHVKKGDGIIISLWAMGRMENVWGPDAEEYKPTRFIGKQYSQWKFFSFNAGRRICLGKSLAYLEAKTAIATIIKDFDISLPPGLTEKTYLPSLTCAPKDGIQVHVKHRVPKVSS